VLASRFAGPLKITGPVIVTFAGVSVVEIGKNTDWADELSPALFPKRTGPVCVKEWLVPDAKISVPFAPTDITPLLEVSNPVVSKVVAVANA
jgi:hypothetical protein